MLEFCGRSRIARVGVPEWIVGECRFTHLGLRNRQISHPILTVLVPPMPSTKYEHRQDDERPRDARSGECPGDSAAVIEKAKR